MSWSFFSSRYLLNRKLIPLLDNLFFFLFAQISSFLSRSSRSFSENICIDLSYFYLHDILLFLANATNWVNTKSHRLIHDRSLFHFLNYISREWDIYISKYQWSQLAWEFDWKKFFLRVFRRKNGTILTAVEFRVCQTRNVKRTQSLVGAIKSWWFSTFYLILKWLFWVIIFLTLINFI